MMTTMKTCKKLLMSLVSLLLVSSACAAENWIQYAKTEYALYELDGNSITVDPSINVKVFKLRVTPIKPFVRDDKITVKFYHEYGLAMCNELRYILTGQEHYDLENKFIDSNIATNIYKPKRVEHDATTHLLSIVCRIPFVDNEEGV